MANDFMRELLTVSLTTSAVIALLLIFTPLLRKRYAAKWRYLAWLIVAVRLLIPLTPSLPQAPVQIPVAEPAPTEMTLAAEPMQNALPAPAPQADEGVFAEQEVTPSTPGQPKAFSPAGLMLVIWAAGMIAFFLVQAAVYLRFRRKLRYSPQGEISDRLRDTLQEIGTDMGMACLPEIRVCVAVPAPILTGLLRPVLFLPHDRYTGRELAYILRHELVHYRRRDLWYKLALTVANGMHWFNPLVYLMNAQASRDVELSCDDAVMAGLGGEERAFYGEAILNALPIKAKWRLEPVFTTSFGSTKASMKQRLKNLFDSTIKKRGIAALCAVVLLAGMIGGVIVFTPMAVAAESTKEMSFSIDNIAAGEAVCIGKIELKSGVSYNLNAATQSGTQWAVGLNKSGDITSSDASGIAWNQYYGGAGRRQIDALFSSRQNGSYYVYVMSTGSKLTGVSGALSTDNPYGSVINSLGNEKTQKFDVVRFSQSDGRRVSFGPYALAAGKSYIVTITWDEGGSRPLSCIQNTANGSEPIGEYTVKSGVPLTLAMTTSANYCFVIPAGEPQMTNLFFQVDVAQEAANTSSAAMKTAQIGDDTWYLVETEAQLRSIAGNDETLSRKYMQNADIAVTSVWTPLGNEEHPFTGVYNGNGFAIRGLQYKANERLRGLFGYVDYADLQDITIVGLGTGPVVAINLDGELTDSSVVSEEAYRTTAATRASAAQTVSFVNVELRRYSSGSPYIHDIIANNTSKRMMAQEIGMLAFDKDGNPLKLRWNYLSSSTTPKYSFLYDWGDEEIGPGANTDNEDNTGGWSLFSNTGDTPAEVEKVAYVLYNFKQITFADGTVWENPGYASWLKTYEGKTVDVETLKGYYPFSVTVE